MVSRAMRPQIVYYSKHAWENRVLEEIFGRSNVILPTIDDLDRLSRFLKMWRHSEIHHNHGKMEEAREALQALRRDSEELKSH